MAGQVEDWQVREQEGQVELPDGRRIYLKAMGPPRDTADAPAVVLIHGLGGTALEWLEVQRRVARFARVYLYKRSGYSGSDPPPHVPTCANIAAELRELLEAAKIPPPYLMVGQSYGGVIARQFLADDPSSVFGMVLVDSSPVAKRMRVNWRNLLGPAGCADVIGLPANLGINRDEYEAIVQESEINQESGGIAEKELKARYPGDRELQDLLHGKQLLGNRRLCVIFCDQSKDFRKVYAHGVRHGYGTADEREGVREHLDTMSAIEEASHRTQLDLSAVARFVKAEGKRATHDVHLVDPGWITEQIRWVFDGTTSAE